MEKQTLGNVGNRPENAVELVDLRVAREERLSVEHLGKNDADGPNVHRWRVHFLAQQDLWRAVPQCYDLMRVLFDGDAERARQSKVGDLETARHVDEQVLRLEVAIAN